MEERHITSALEILKKIHYINIATVCEDGQPWNTPVSASYDTNLHFYWGSSPDNIHSQNIRRDGRAFVTVYDSQAPESKGEALYFLGTAEELGAENEYIKKYRFFPEQVWMNDEAKHEDGSYRHDVRVELALSSLIERIAAAP